MYNESRFEDLINIEKRTGVKNEDVEDFARKAEDVEKAIKAMMAGEIAPEDVKIEGIDSPEEAAEKERLKQKRLAESRRKAEELRLKRKHEERSRWWDGAEVMAEKNQSKRAGNADTTVVGADGEEYITEEEKIKQRYNADYSRWNDWTPTDSASLEEIKRLKDEAEEKKNKEFESNNKDFCDGFVDDMNKRNKAIEEKKESAEAIRNKGNRLFKRKDFDGALKEYMESLRLQAYEAKTLTNVAQAYIKKQQWPDAFEFLNRVLYLEPDHVKALSRKAFVLSEVPEGSLLPLPPLEEDGSRMVDASTSTSASSESKAKEEKGLDLVVIKKEKETSGSRSSETLSEFKGPTTEAGGVKESITVVASALEILEMRYARKYNAVEGKYNGVEATEAQQKEWDDMKGQLQEMQVIAQEKEDEAALREVLFKEKSTFEKNEKDKDTSPTHASPATLSGSTDTKTADVAIMPPTAPAQTRVRSNDTQFALLERLFGLLSEGQPESVEGGMYSPEALLSTLLSSSGNGLNKWDQATILLNLCIQLVESPTDGAHKLARVYCRTSGLLSRLVSFAHALLLLCQAHTAHDGIKGPNRVLGTVFHLLSACVRADRAAKLLLLEAPLSSSSSSSDDSSCIDNACKDVTCGTAGTNTNTGTGTGTGTNTNLLAALSAGLSTLSEEKKLPLGILYGYSRLLHACCSDDVSTKVRDWVYCDHGALLLISKALGDAVEAAAQSGADSPPSMQDMAALLGKGQDQAQGDKDKEKDKAYAGYNVGAGPLAMVQATSEAIALVLKEVTFSKTGQDTVRKQAQSVGAAAVCGLAYALRFSTAACVMAGVEELVGGLGGLGGALEGLGLKNENNNNNDSSSIPAPAPTAASASIGRVESQATTCMSLLEALLGCSQIDLCRDYFAGDSPWKTDFEGGQPDFFGNAISKGAAGQKFDQKKGKNGKGKEIEKEKEGKSTGVAIVLGAIEVLGPRKGQAQGVSKELAALLQAQDVDPKADQPALAPDAAPTGLAVLLNACLDTTGEVRNAVHAHGGLVLAIAGLEAAAEGMSGQAEQLLVARQTGLLSRLAVLPVVQKHICSPRDDSDSDYQNYRSLCTAIRQYADALYGPTAPVGGGRERELEILGSLVRTLGAVGPIAGKDRECIGAGVGCGIVPALLSIFPEPRRELGKVTPESVILPPKYDQSPSSNKGPRPGGMLLGNAARCLMPYADAFSGTGGDDSSGIIPDAAGQGCLQMYQQRENRGVERMICAMATISDMPVRQNLSILLAKGCRVPGVRDVVHQFRGIQMMQELQSKFKL